VTKDIGFVTAKETAWCPGCGNFGILRALSRALEELGAEAPRRSLCLRHWAGGAKRPTTSPVTC